MLLHPLVGGGSDGLPHLPDLSQPDHQRGREWAALLQLRAITADVSLVKLAWAGFVISYLKHRSEVLPPGLMTDRIRGLPV